jgi:hypothetical protein
MHLGVDSVLLYLEGATARLEVLLWRKTDLKELNARNNIDTNSVHRNYRTICSSVRHGASEKIYGVPAVQQIFLGEYRGYERRGKFEF